MLRDWVIASLEASGVKPTPENTASLTNLAKRETGANPNFDNGEVKGLYALTPETWEWFNAGGEVLDPVANGVAAINYMLFVYRGIPDFNEKL